MRRTFLSLPLAFGYLLLCQACGGGSGTPDESPISLNICEGGWIESSSPENGAINVPVNATITVVAKEGTVMTDLVVEDFVLTTSVGEIEFTLTIDAETRTASLTPNKNLPAGAPVLIYLDYGSCNKSGNSQYSLTFSTAGDAGSDTSDNTTPDTTPPSGITPSLRAWTRATLEWLSPGDDGVVGTASRYEIRYSQMPIENVGDFENATSVAGAPKPQISGSAEEYTLPRMNVGKYYFAIRAYDEADNGSTVTSTQIEIAGRSTKGLEATAERGQYDYMGRTTAGNCDVNGDGLKDVIAGVAYDDTAGANNGRVVVYLGKAGSEMGTLDNGAYSPDFIINGATTGDRFGWSIACGDFNGDGFDDIAAGAPYYGASDEGAVFLFYGSNTIAGTIPAANYDALFKGNKSAAYFGWSVSLPGDLDKDGKFELISVASDDGVSKEGVAYLFYGDALTTETVKNDSDATTKINGENTSSKITKVASAGDIDGDGNLDLAFGTTYPVVNLGTVYILLGKNGYPAIISLTSDADLIFRGVANNDFMGGKDEYDPAFSITGDLNSDGKNDLIIGVPGFSGNTGKVYVFYGRSDWTAVTSTNDADVTITGRFGSDGFGWSLEAGGDFNKDGKDDLIVGSPYFDDGVGGDRGGAFIFFGHGNWETTMDSLDADVIISTSAGIFHNIGLTSASGSDYWGESVHFLGDTDGDGYDDVALGGSYAEANDSGGIYIIQ
ncbi:MAG: Ig-like domain-containing protein [Pseudomonadota bacterium]